MNTTLFERIRSILIRQSGPIDLETLHRLLTDQPQPSFEQVRDEVVAGVYTDQIRAVTTRTISWKWVPVIVESPFAGDVERNVAYARAAMHDCLLKGEAPYASHLLYTQPGVLDDNHPSERVMGITAGFAWRHKAAYTVFYTDLGMSKGMELALQQPGEKVFRSIPAWAPVDL